MEAATRQAIFDSSPFTESSSRMTSDENRLRLVMAQGMLPLRHVDVVRLDELAIHRSPLSWLATTAAENGAWPSVEARVRT